MTILDDLDARGLVHDTTDRESLAAALASPVALYHGIDPTADSLHVGNFVGVLVLRRFQDAGHRPLVLVGGATGMVGDPSGRSDERSLLDEQTLAANVAAIRGQLERFLDFSRADLVDNHEWTAPLTLIEFLRDVGKHATVNQMIAKDSVRSRMESEQGISFTEFSYMLLQANDYQWLHEHRDVSLQIGGSDQWGNITAGIDLIRRRSGGTAHGLTWPLVTRSDGTKFGKSAGENIWLSAERTSPYRFFQYWMQTDDRDIERFLLQLTLLPVSEVAEIVATHERSPDLRSAQRRLAEELTMLVHGQEATAGAAEATDALFGGGSIASPAGYAALTHDVPTTTIGADELGGAGALVDLLARTGLTKSKGEARRALAEGSVYVHGERRSDDSIDLDDVQFDRYVLLRRGKRTHHLVVVDR